MLSGVCKAVCTYESSGSEVHIFAVVWLAWMAVCPSIAGLAWVRLLVHHRRQLSAQLVVLKPGSQEQVRI